MIDVPVEVKKVLKKGRGRKRYRIEVYNVSGQAWSKIFTITNANIVKESVRIDERMCSGKYLKFGLCEGASLEFQYFDLPNVTGKGLKVYVEVYYQNGSVGAWYPIIMGNFIVEQCSLQFSTGIRKVVAYNKLMSDYLDADATADITALVENGSLPVTMILNTLLKDYAIETEYEKLEIGIPAFTFYGLGGIDSNHVYHKKSNGDIERGYLYVANVLIELGLHQHVDHDKSYQFIWAYYNTINFMRNYFRDSEQNFLMENCFMDSECTIDYIDWLGEELENEYGEKAKAYGTLDTFTSDSTEIYNRLRLISNIYKDRMTSYAYNGIGGIFSGLYTNLINYPSQTPYVINIRMPLFMEFKALNDPPAPSWTREQAEERANIIFNYLVNSNFDPIDGNIFQINNINSNLGETRIDATSLNNTSGVTLRELQSAVYETKCQYGQIDRRTDLFRGVELDATGLYPSESLYPANDLYPNGDTGGNAIHPFPAEYQQLWTDTVGLQTFRYLRITYKTIEDNQEVEKVLQRTVYEHGTTDYNMSDNWLFLNLVWDAATIGQYADDMVIKMRKISWFPFEMWSVGLPYIETGDAIEITDREGNTYTSYVLQRQLSGIQNLQDTYINGELNVF